MRTGRILLLSLAVVTTSCARIRASVAQSPPARTVASGVLQVPYVSQSELLCGGAALAMIERWWGRRGVYAEEFAHLVRETAGGIRTTDMAMTMRSRGWATQALPATDARVRQSLADSVPVIALIRIADTRYHYVVIVGWSGETVTYHDPAANPSVTLHVSEFLRRWHGAERWAMFVRPATSAARNDAIAVAPQRASLVDSLPCRPFLDQAADAAADNRLADADRILAAARASCPNEPVVLREQAGVRFRQGTHAEATRLADEYTRREPFDSLGWQLLASSRYLAGDKTGALQAWNVVGRPTIDLLRVAGGRRIRFRVLADAAGASSGAALTPTRFALAQRRIADIPALALARVQYDAVGGGAVEVAASVVERPLTDPIAQVLVVEASRAAATRQIIVGVSTLLGLGERWTAHWRWRSADPLLALRLDIPVHVVAPAVVRLERSWETFRFSSGIADEQRRASAISIAGWARPDLELRSGARFERWTNDGNFVALQLGGAIHRADDRLSLMAEAEHAIPVTGTRNASYNRFSSRLAWELPADRWMQTWSMRVGSEWNTASTPRGLWPIAGGGLMRQIPLRAHPLIINNRLPAARTGTLIIHGGVAGDKPVTTVGRLALGAGIFIDGANVASPGDGSRASRWYLDGGAGLRISVAGLPWAAARVDLARGLATDRRWGVTAALLQTLPVRLSRPR